MFFENVCVSNESDSKNNFSRSRSIGSDPGILEIPTMFMNNLAELEMSRIRNELRIGKLRNSAMKKTYKMENKIPVNAIKPLKGLTPVLGK